jgi:hypothetical protein
MASATEAHYDETNKNDVERRGSVAKTEKGRWERLWPVIACGAGLFSDGYLNNVRLPNAATFPERLWHYMARAHASWDVLNLYTDSDV